MKTLITLLFLLSTFAFAAEEKVIDLGQLEVEGELRRPKVQWIDSSQKVSGWLSSIHEQEFYRLEKELLKPITVKEAQNIVATTPEDENANR